MEVYEMARKGENIYKRRDGRWEARLNIGYDVDGKTKYKYIYADSYKEVKHKKKLAELEIFNLENAENNLNSKQKKSIITFEMAARDWLRTKQIGTKDSTLSNYDSLLKKHILPLLGKYPLFKMNTEFIEGFLNKLLSSGRADGKGGLSPATVQMILAVIKGVFKHANAKYICDFDRIKIKKDEKSAKTLTSQEQMKLAQSLCENIDNIKLGVLLCLTTGIRVGELCALRWENIDLAEETLFIKQTMQRVGNTTKSNGKAKTKVIITSPKSKSAVRKIPIPLFLITYMREFVAKPKAFLLSGEENKFIEPRTVQLKFKSYLKDAEIDDMNFHGLRHSFATRWAEEGFDAKCSSEILGHASVNITLAKYVHSSFDLKRNNINKLNAKITDLRK